ncbi:MAG: biotin--[acetyl-CoA-carboxylase] ligase [Crocinitomicaceae bacterium]
MTTIGNQLYHLDSVDSTNNFTAKIINDQICQNGAVILADEQTAGKGQMGNTWESERGSNLLCSIAWRPDNLSVNDQSKLSWLVALILHKLLLRFGINAEIKWPNDIYVQKQKIAGILIENQIEGKNISWVIVGIGLNVNQQVFQNANATSMKNILGTTLKVKTVLSELTDLFNGYLNQWDVLQDTFKSEFEANLYQKNIKAIYSDKSGKFEGELMGVQDDGRIVIRVGEENRIYDLKEVQFC